MAPPRKLQFAPPKVLQLCLGLLILSFTVFSRFGINFGTYSLNASLIAIYILVALSLLSGNLVIAPPRLLAYGVCVFLACVSFLLNRSFSADSSSWTSLLLLVTIYFPFSFAFRTRGNQREYVLWTTRLFSNVALFCAFAGIAQFCAQFFIHSDWLFDFTSYIPERFQGPSGYNTVIPMGSLYKSNGFFFREPSGASFVMALGLLVEIALFHRPLRRVCLGLALVFTYSGTGVLALLIGIAFSVRRQTFGRMMLGMAAAGLCLWALSDTLHLSYTLGRVNEFSSERSSAYIRYIAPMRLVGDVLFSQPWSFLFGLGPGMILRLSHVGYQFHDPTWAKLLVEYGALGFGAFVVLMVACVRRQRFLPLQLRVVLFTSWLIMGGHLLMPENVYLVLLLTGLLGYACPAQARQQTAPCGYEPWPAGQ